MGGDAEPGQHQREMLAQRQIAERVPVFEQIGAVLAREHIEALADAGFVEPRIRQPGAARKDSVLVRLQQSADEPDQLLVALVIVRWGRMRRIRSGRRGRCVEAGATARLQIAHRNQPVVGLDHGEAADLVGIGEVADRRQFGAGPQMPIVDLSLDAGDDLVGERLVAILTDGEGEHSDFPASQNWPGRWTSTVTATDRHIVYCRVVECSALWHGCQVVKSRANGRSRCGAFK